MNKPIKVTLQKLAPAVLVSLIATSLGLLSLYRSEVPMIQDFGKMLTIGIAVAFVFAVLILIPILYLNYKLDNKNIIEINDEPKKYDLFANKFANGVVKLRYVIIIFAIAIAALGFYLDTEVGVETDIETFMPQDSEALLDIQELRDIIGSTERIIIMYETTDVNSFDTLSEVKKLSEEIDSLYGNQVITMASVPLLLDIVSDNKWEEETLDKYLNELPESQLKLLYSEQDNLGVIQMSLEEMTDDEFESFLIGLEELLDEYSTLNPKITGQSIVDYEMLNAMTSGRLEITLVGILLVFGALVIIYRNIFKAIIPILPIIVIVGWNGLIMYLFEFDYTPLTSTLGALIIGIGTEFTILIMMRFYEEKDKSNDSRKAIQIALSKMSKPIIVSAVTTMGGFSALILSDFEILSNFGIMTLINIGLALISALVVLPAFLGILSKQSEILS